MSKTGKYGRPLAPRVLIRRDVEKEVTDGGLILPADSREVPLSGEVVETHNDSVGLTPEVRVGQRVLFSKYAGSEVTMGGETLLILREEDIMLVLPDEPEK